MLEQLLQRQAVWRGGAPQAGLPAVPTGYPALDKELAGGGWPPGRLIEILSPLRGIGELQLFLPALAALTWAGKRVVWIAPPHLPYAPALAAGGIDLAQLAVVQAPGRRDALWAAEQVLRAGCAHAVLAWLGRSSFDELRRLAVAAESGPAWVALSLSREAGPSPACLRLALEPAGDALGIRILKRRGAPAAAPLFLQVKRPVDALARASLPGPAAGGAATDRRLGLPVHA